MSINEVWFYKRKDIAIWINWKGISDPKAIFERKNWARETTQFLGSDWVL